MTSAASRLPLEMQLLVQSARMVVSDDARDRIRTLASGPVNWEAFFDSAARHQVVPLAFRSLKQAAGSQVPGKVMRRLAAQALITTRRNRLFADELVRLNTILEGIDAHVIFYKGPVTAVLIYGDLASRQFGDIDFLVRRDQLDRVCERLAEEGYVNQLDVSGAEKLIEEREQKEYCLKSGPITLEPHWSITARRFPFEIDYPGLWRRAREVTFNGSRIRTFSIEDMMLVLCVCGSKARWWRLQMISDVAEAVRAFPEVNWDVCFDRAREAGCTRMLEIGLHLVRELLDVPLPDPVHRHMRESRSLSRLGDRLIAGLTKPMFTNPWNRQGAAVFSPTLWALREGPRDKLRYLVRTATTPRVIHLRRFPLQRSLHWAYRIIVPLHDYVASPAAYLGRRALTRFRSRAR